MSKKIIFAITNDPYFDQRMQRICTALQEVGYDVLLIGRKMRDAPESPAPYRVKRLRCLFHRGPWQYLEYHIRLFFLLLPKKADMLCAIDIDTILPVYYASRLKRVKRVYDAHEYFSELKEVVTRPNIQRWWKRIESFAIPKFQSGYTVSQSIAQAFHDLYGVNYELIRNVPNRRFTCELPANRNKAILYQGAVNEARGFEFLIPAMKKVDAELHIYGSGNMENTCKALAVQYGVSDKIRFFGMVTPARLQEITGHYYIGINLVEKIGLNQYYSLANKFFDYIQARVPQVTMNFPEYARINQEAPVAILLDDLDVDSIASALNLLLADFVLYRQLVDNCAVLQEKYCWEIEKNRLLKMYEKLC